MTKYIGPKTDGENVATQADKLSLSSETPDALTPDQTGAAGTATTAARSDHQHEILAAAAGTITGVSNTEGTSTSFARADHTHAISLPRCTATRTTTQSIANNTTTVVSFTSETIDTDSFHSTASNQSRITIPSGLDGDYIVTAALVFAGGDTGRRSINILKNGSALSPEIQAGAPAINLGSSGRLSVAGLISLAATDYVELNCFHAQGTSLDVLSAQLSVIRVG